MSREGHGGVPACPACHCRGDQRAAPGAESTIGKEFYTANSEALVDTMVDETRYLGAPIVIGGGITHHVELDLSQNVLSVKHHLRN
jgi:hypothetical protein